MGGPGSDSYYRWSKQTTKEELKRIDIRYMKKAGLLKPDRKGTLSWTSNGKPSGEIRYTILKDKMILNYRFQEQDEVWKPVEQTILIRRTTRIVAANSLVSLPDM